MSNQASDEMNSTVTVIPEYRGGMPRVSSFRGAVIQTGAIFVDAYRELNHRKMFWIVLIISALVVVGFAAVAIDQNGISIFGIELGIPFNTSMISRADFYKLMFNNFAVQWWLGWGAAILALISTAGIFPDLLTGGSVDLYLSKPISRLRLFLTKYVAALLFVGLQVSVFCIASFFVIGIRGGAWLWALFLAVPLVVCIYSYLYAICTLVGVLTRSTLAALLMTVLIWLGISIVSGTDTILLTQRIDRQLELEAADAHITAVEARVKQLETAAATLPTTKPAPAVATTRSSDEGFFSYWARSLVQKQQQAELDRPQDALVTTKAELQRLRAKRAEETNPFIFWQDLTVKVKTFLPKTSETLEILDRGLQYYADLPSDGSYESEDESPPPAQGGHRHSRRSADDRDVLGARVKHEILSRSIGWVVGTSLCFEAVVLGLAALVFVRRDY